MGAYGESGLQKGGRGGYALQIPPQIQVPAGSPCLSVNYLTRRTRFYMRDRIFLQGIRTNG